MARVRGSDVLLALAEAAGSGAVDGNAVLAVLTASRSGRVGADQVLVRLLELETGGLVEVQRQRGLHFRLTVAGERAVGDLGGGQVVAASLLMVDLVGFVAFTERHGDAEAHQASQALRAVGEAVLRDLGGRVVKTSGDGLFAAADPAADLVEASRLMAKQLCQPDGTPWPLRASVHRGSPIAHKGDLFGRDVNLLARLCELASPDQLVRTLEPGEDVTEVVAVRGVDEPVPITRVALR